MADGEGVMARPVRSPAYQAALAALREAGLPCSAYDTPETLLAALQPLIIAAATADPWVFDRARYDWLMGLWETLHTEQDASTEIP